jgi:hypothetical protein
LIFEKSYLDNTCCGSTVALAAAFLLSACSGVGQSPVTVPIAGLFAAKPLLGPVLAQSMSSAGPAQPIAD